MEDIISLLEDIKGTLSSVCVFLGLCFAFVFGICLIVFFNYYDKCKDDEKKRLISEIKSDLDKKK